MFLPATAWGVLSVCCSPLCFAREGGLLITGSFALLQLHLKGLALVSVFCGVGGYLALKPTRFIIPLTVIEDLADQDLDPNMHGESIMGG